MTYFPDQALIERYAIRYNWEKENLLAALSEFGVLSEEGQEQLIRCLVQAFSRFQFEAKTKERITPSQQRNALKVIEKHINSLLQQLKKPIVSMWLTTAGISIEGKDAATVNAESRIASARVFDAIRALEDLHSRARTAIATVSKHIAPGHGGSRHRPTAKGQLIMHAIAVYSHIRGQHPASGARPAFGGPLVRFVSAVGKLFAVSVKEIEIREIWLVWKSKQKKS
jgi:hypothetical protein